MAPRAGALVGFPSGPDYEHEVTRGQRGARYTIAVWFTKEPQRVPRWAGTTGQTLTITIPHTVLAQVGVVKAVGHQGGGPARRRSARRQLLAAADRLPLFGCASASGRSCRPRIGWVSSSSRGTMSAAPPGRPTISWRVSQ